MAAIAFKVITRPNLDKLAREINVRAKRLRADLTLFFKQDLGPEVAAFVRKTMDSRGIQSRTGQIKKSIVGGGTAGRSQAALLTVSIIGPSKVEQRAVVLEVGTRSENPRSAIPDITPVNARFLTVPANVGDAAKMSVRDLGEDLQALMFGKLGGMNNNVAGKLVSAIAFQEERESAIAEERKPDFSGLTPIFFLLTFVKVKPRFYVRRGVEEYFPTIMKKLLERIENLDILRQGEMIEASARRAETLISTRDTFQIF